MRVVRVWVFVETAYLCPIVIMEMAAGQFLLC